MTLPSLLGVPSEIRSLVFDHLEAKRATYQLQICQHGVCNACADTISISQVNKQIRDEVLEILSIEKLQINIPAGVTTTPAWRLPDFVEARKTQIRNVIIASDEGDGNGNDTFVTYWPPALILDRIRDLLVQLPKLESVQMDQDFEPEDIAGWKEMQDGDRWTMTIALNPHERYYRSLERRASALSLRLGLTLHGFDRFSYSIQRVHNRSKMMALRTKLTFEKRKVTTVKASTTSFVGQAH